MTNRDQNREFREAVRRIEGIIERQLTADEEQRVHREISGWNYSLEDIVNIGVAMFG
jgi:hypothetical protein